MDTETNGWYVAVGVWWMACFGSLTWLTFPAAIATPFFGLWTLGGAFLVGFGVYWAIMDSRSSGCETRNH